jgi:SET domain-containing protein 6
MSKEKRKSSAPTQGSAKHRKSEKPPADTSRRTAAAPDEYLPRPEHTGTERAYLDWMRRRGVELHGVTIGRFPRTGRGCVATRDISPGEVLVEVPDDCIITSQTCVAADALRELDDAVAEDPSPRLEREALVLAVMAEMSLGADSAFAPYLAALPTLRATHSPLAWSGAELAELEGTTALARMSLEDEAAELPSMTAAHWKHVARPFLEANPRFARVARAEDEDEDEDEDDDEDDDDENESRKLYLHATALVAGFSFTLGEPDVDEDDSDEDDSGGHVSTQAMVPFWDMLNHREPAEASVRLDYDEATSRLRMIAVKRVAAGEEVFNTYGALGDDELLRRYGFVMRRNPHGGGAEVTLREVVEAARLARSQTAPLDVESNPDSDSDSDDYAPPVMPPMSDSEEEEDDDAEMDDDEDDEEEEDDDASLDGDSPSAGPLSRGEILERLRLMRRWGVASRSSDRFAVSRTGRPSRALRVAARVLSMDREPFREVLAADAYERGEGDDQTGAYSDEDDEDEGEDDGFGGFKPLTVEQVWNGENVLGACRTSTIPFFFSRTRGEKTGEAAFPSSRDRVITTPLWDLLGAEKFR